MAGAHDSNILIGEIALGGLILICLWRLIAWVRECPVTSNPWGDEIEKQLCNSDAVEICHHCFTPCPADGWFCERCGGSVGPYNNWMPFVRIFAEGEVFRNGVNCKLRPSALIVAGYLLAAFSAYAFLAPIYLYFFFRNLGQAEENLPVEAKFTSPDSPP
jgi:hypothetical protein